MIRFLADENLNGAVVRAVRRARPEIDIVRVQDTEIAEGDDEAVLEWAAQHGRVLLTHDVNTLPALAYQRVVAGRPMPGVFEISPRLPIGRVLEDIVLLAHCSRDDEWEGQVRYLPL